MRGGHSFDVLVDVPLLVVLFHASVSSFGDAVFCLMVAVHFDLVDGDLLGHGFLSLASLE